MPKSLLGNLFKILTNRKQNHEGNRISNSRSAEGIQLREIQ